jgi:hypothetical protein
MRNKKAKGLRRLARAMVAQMNLNPTEIEKQYKKMKSAYKASKGHI